MGFKRFLLFTEGVTSVFAVICEENKKNSFQKSIKNVEKHTPKTELPETLGKMTLMNSKMVKTPR